MASRKEQKERLRQERLEREQAAAASAAARRRMGYVVAGGLVAAVVAALAVIALTGGGSDSGKGGGGSKSWGSGSVPKQKETDLATAAKLAGCVVQHPKSEGRTHTAGTVKYKTAPPTSGPHYPVPAHDGAYLTAPKPYESLVHALEHGRVIIWFKPSVPAKVRGSLKKLYDEDKSLMILTANPRAMPYEVAATAWTRLLGCPAYNDSVPDAIRAFRHDFRLKGPEYFPNAE